MNEAEQRLAADRGNRQTARGLFDRRLAQVKSDLSASSVPARIKAKARDEVFAATDTAIDVARESKGVIAATLGAMALWLFRKPLLKAVGGWFGQGAVQDDPDNAPEQPDEEQQA